MVGKYWEEWEELRGNSKWYMDMQAGKFSWEPTPEIDLSTNEETLKKIDVYNFEIKTVNFINKLTIADFPKQIPMVFFWSPYFDSPTATSREKVRILKKDERGSDEDLPARYVLLRQRAAPDGARAAFELIYADYERATSFVWLYR